jgi:hypothetical protein
MRRLLTAIVATALLSSTSNAATFTDVVTRPYKGTWQWQCVTLTTQGDKLLSEQLYGGWRGSFATRAKAEGAARC